MLRNELKLYLSVPFFTESQQGLVNELEEMTENLGFNVFSPSRDGMKLPPNADLNDRRRAFSEGKLQIISTDIVVASLCYDPSDSSDSRSIPDNGVAFDVGYANAFNKIVVMFNGVGPQNLMLIEACTAYVEKVEQLPGLLSEVMTMFGDPVNLSTGKGVSCLTSLAHVNLSKKYPFIGEVIA